ncbi:DUF6086 family protein [Candidatus Entotheonella palauensis]|uniref:Uncharacterized protein n=1 Tax=Candidatus Entotheonella gemina TaxID=1429439 RepID=W4MFY4_9BACT|nr:DUF6086 family protein [Candidatus Entotheonella palauensis]ETX08582.1 MAG: hypothetical protein ETSY2_04540 [Candidatus Entotheonella gemina]
MGMQVYCNNRALWAPSLQVGTLFLNQIRALEPIVGLESGIENPLADMLEIEASAFATFIQRLLHLLDTTNNGPLFALAAGCTEVALVLHADITEQWPVVSDRLKSLLHKAQTVMSALPERQVR